MTGALLRNRLRVAGHHFRALEPSERFRLVLIIALLAGVLGWWATHRLGRTLDLQDPAAIRSAIRIEAYRLGVFLAAFVGFTSFGALWRSKDLEVLNRLPVPPRDLFIYRLTVTLTTNLPLLLLTMAGFLPLLWQGYPDLAIEAAIYLVALYVLTGLWSMRWHIFAGASVATPAYESIKQRLAGTMVLPERTLLLYSPFLAALFGFLSGLLVLTGLSALARGELAFGVGASLAAAAGGAYAWRRARQDFELAYYQAVAALADGELMGEIGESAPGPAYLGTWYVDKLPAAIRPLVARDLRQAWRRNRLDHFALLIGSAAFAVLTLNRGTAWLEAGYFWPSLWLVLALAAGQGFRLTRVGNDAPWLWLTLPLTPRAMYQGRLASTLFFAVMVAPALTLAGGWAGAGWGYTLLFMALVALGASIAAVNLALSFFTQRRLAGILYLGIVALPAILSPDQPLVAGGILLSLAALTFWPLRRIRERLAGAEQAQ